MSMINLYINSQYVPATIKRAAKMDFKEVIFADTFGGYRNTHSTIHLIFCCVRSKPQSENWSKVGWFLLELSALKITTIAYANIKFLDESFSHTNKGDIYLYLDLFICYHKSWMFPWAETSMFHRVKNWGGNFTKMLVIAWTMIHLHWWFNAACQLCLYSGTVK